MHAVKIIDKEIGVYLNHLNTQQKKVVLSVIKTFAHEEDVWWEEVETSAQHAIEKGMHQIKKGQLTPHKTVMQKYKKWLSK